MEKFNLYTFKASKNDALFGSFGSGCKLFIQCNNFSALTDTVWLVLKENQSQF